ncbi:MAG TPA: hypothetical protein VFT53_02265 [Candidatus Saccharimonadales bacterium]|nr:hypothetical protein [Candidatus Saccharimonadales bacterium]
MDTQLKRRFPRYARWLRLYPGAYRNRYGEEMLQTLADMLDYSVSAAERRRVWIRTVLDLPLAAAQQQLITLGETMHQSALVKRSSIISGALLLPFFAALAANALDKTLRNQTLYHSSLWSMPWLALWVLYLPLMAGSVAVIGIIVALLRNRSQDTLSIVTWPLVGIAIVALAIVGMVFFHDSVHCVTGNPVRELRNLHATLSCIGQR